MRTKKKCKDTAVNYRQANKWVKPKRHFKTVPKGSWLPVSIVAHLSGVSHQTIRLLYLSRQVIGLKFPVGPMLINLDEVQEVLKGS